MIKIEITAKTYFEAFKALQDAVSTFVCFRDTIGQEGDFEYEMKEKHWTMNMKVDEPIEDRTVKDSDL